LKGSAITAVSGSSTRLYVEAADVNTSWLESSMLQMDYFFIILLIPTNTQQNTLLAVGR
jgi:hypothetical protein